MDGTWGVYGMAGHEQSSRRRHSYAKNGVVHFLDGAARNPAIAKHLLTVTHSYGGREASLEAKAKMEANRIAQDGKSIAGDAKAGAENIVGDVKQKVEELKQKVVK